LEERFENDGNAGRNSKRKRVEVHSWSGERKSIKRCGRRTITNSAKRGKPANEIRRSKEFKAKKEGVKGIKKLAFLFKKNLKRGAVWGNWAGDFL